MMEGRRRQKGENHKRSAQSRKPPRGSWQPTVPSWEKDFCKVVGSLEWETLLQMKKFMHLYSDVLNWNDSAGEEAFYNAKKRYWAEINGLPCDIPSPGPDLYIDRINWDSETELEFPQDVESKQFIPNTGDDHDPVVIFGDSLLLNHAYLPVGWGDDEENLDVPFNHSSPQYLMATQAFQPTGWGDCEEKLEVPVNHHSSVHYIDPWDQNWGNTLDSVATPVWPGYSDNAWQFSGPTPAGYMSWSGTDWNNGNWGWNYANNECSYAVEPEVKEGRGDSQGFWNEGTVAPPNASKTVFSHDNKLGFWNENKVVQAKTNTGGNGLNHSNVQEFWSESHIAPVKANCGGNNSNHGNEQGFWNESHVAPVEANAGGNGLSHGDEQGFWNESNIAPAKTNACAKGLSHGSRRAQGKGRHKNHTNRNDNKGQRDQSAGAERRSMPRKWNSMNSCNGGVVHNVNAAAIAVGRSWDR